MAEQLGLNPDWFVTYIYMYIYIYNPIYSTQYTDTIGYMMAYGMVLIYSWLFFHPL